MAGAKGVQLAMARAAILEGTPLDRSSSAGFLSDADPRPAHARRKARALHHQPAARSFPRATPPFPRVAWPPRMSWPIRWPSRIRGSTRVDWDRTIAFRHHLWSLGLGVAEAMDTAQRGMGLDWTAAQQLIRLSLEPRRLHARRGDRERRRHRPSAPGPDVTVDDVIRAYEEQCEAVEAMGGRIILMASRALAGRARTRRLRARL
jgi:hypothetical protein